MRLLSCCIFCLTLSLPGIVTGQKLKGFGEIQNSQWKLYEQKWFRWDINKDDILTKTELAYRCANDRVIAAANAQKAAAAADRRKKQGAALLSNPKLSNSEKAILLERWVRDSEQLGNQLLDLKQREKLVQLMLARYGMVTLGRSDVRRCCCFRGDNTQKH